MADLNEVAERLIFQKLNVAKIRHLFCNYNIWLLRVNWEPPILCIDLRYFKLTNWFSPIYILKLNTFKSVISVKRFSNFGLSVLLSKFHFKLRWCLEFWIGELCICRNCSLVNLQNNWLQSEIILRFWVGILFTHVNHRAYQIPKRHICFIQIVLCWFCQVKWISNINHNSQQPTFKNFLQHRKWTMEHLCRALSLDISLIQSHWHLHIRDSGTLNV